MYSLNKWTKPGSEEARLYIKGTTRPAVYFCRAADGGHALWSSRENDTPARYRKGNHSQKIAKDRQAALDVATRYGVKLGKDGDADGWERLLKAAEEGLQVTESEDDLDD